MSSDTQASFEIIINLRGIDQPCRNVTICALLDDVLLKIFGFHVDRSTEPPEDALDAWHTLVHVCRQWRYVAFSSPRSLKLRLRCTSRRPVEMMLDIWPGLPIVVEGRIGIWQKKTQEETNIITALDQRDRVCQIDLSPIPISLLRRINTIKGPFPALTDFKLYATSEMTPALNDSFLGGSAPRLRSLHLNGIPFPALPILLLSTFELVDLELCNIPAFGYISPESMASSLASLTRLQKLFLGFQSPQSRDTTNQLSLPPLTRIVLPALTSLRFISDDWYFEDIFSRIDTPLLGCIDIEAFDNVAFDTPQLRDLISRTEAFKEPHRAVIQFFNSHIFLDVFSRRVTTDHKLLELRTPRMPWYQRPSSFTQFCSSALPPLPTLERLEIHKCGGRWEVPIGINERLELLRPFTSVKNLVLFDDAAEYFAPVLQGLSVESASGTLPALKHLSLKVSVLFGPTQEAIARFIATRQLSGRPVTVLYDD